ncbi:MAG: outer membrane protein [Alphaproteobacteria bacterium]
MRSRSSLLCIVVVAALSGGPAAAADGVDWSGLYVGISGGYFWVDQYWRDSANWSGGYTITTHPAGASFGGVVGYNLVLGGVLIGAETDVSLLDIKDKRTFNNITYSTGIGTTTYSTGTGTGYTPPGGVPMPGGGGVSTTTTTPATTSVLLKSKWPGYATFRGRAGLPNFPFDGTLVYATAGIVIADWTDAWYDKGACPAGWTCNFVKRGTTPGVAFGGGAEYAITEHLMLTSQLLVMSFESRTAPALYLTPNGVPYNFKMPSDAAVVRVGANWKF